MTVSTTNKIGPIPLAIEHPGERFGNATYLSLRGLDVLRSTRAFFHLLFLDVMRSTSSKAEFPQLFPTQLNDSPIQAVNARDLHRTLESGTDYSDWIRRRITRYQFVENVDYTSFLKVEKRENGATTLKEYSLSIDMAKELAMIENTEKGRQIRRYFIAMEKVATSEIVNLPPTPQASVMPVGKQLSMFDLPDANVERARQLCVDVALQAKAGSKMAQFIRLVKPLLFDGGKGGFGK